jgi:hypothetical protein
MLNYRRFCPSCATRVLDAADMAPGMRMLPVGTLDDPSWVKPAMEIYCDSAQPWVSLGGEWQRQNLAYSIVLMRSFRLGCSVSIPSLQEIVEIRDKTGKSRKGRIGIRKLHLRTSGNFSGKRSDLNSPLKSGDAGTSPRGSGDVRRL